MRIAGMLANAILVLLWVLSSTQTTVRAEVTLDGTLTDGIPRDITPVFDPDIGRNDFRIEQDMGRLQGTNLFHSFGRFNLSRTESATFRGSAAINNVISRVTGGFESSINGLVRSTIPGANVYLINPAGILFGPDATLDVKGSFHASTADYIRLQDGTRFNAAPSGADVRLTSAPPAAFGFLDPTPPVAIRVEGGNLDVPEGETLSLIGGAITIDGGRVQAPQGRINLASIEGRGEVKPTPASLEAGPEVQKGSIEVRNGARVSASGEGGGEVYIRGGRLMVQDNSFVFAATIGDDEGGMISGELDQEMIVDGAFISTRSIGGGPGGRIRVKAGEIEIRDGGLVDSSTFSSGAAGSVSFDAETVTLEEGYVAGESYGSGRAGQIDVKADTVRVTEHSQISSTSLFGGEGGSVRMAVSNSVEIVGPHSSTSPNGVFSLTNGGDATGGVFIESDGRLVLDGGVMGAGSIGSGKGGEIRLKVGEIEIRDGGLVDSSAFSFGAAGSVSIDARSVLLDEGKIAAESGFNATGSAGRIRVDTGRLLVRNGSEVSSSGFGSGDGGSVSVTASDLIEISGRHSDENPNGIFNVTNGAGDGGDLAAKSGGAIIMNNGRILTRTFGTSDGGRLTIEGGSLSLRNGAQIFSGVGTVNDDGSLGGDPEGAGNGGVIDVTVRDDLSISGTGPDGFASGISSNAQIGKGSAGDVLVDAASVSISDGGRIFSDTFDRGAGGRIVVRASDRIALSGAAGTEPNISTNSAAGATGNAGTIEIGSPRLDLKAGASIEAVTRGDGNAGNVQISVGTVEIQGAESRVSSSSFSEGVGGDLRVSADRIALTDGGAIIAESLSEAEGAGRSGRVTLGATDRIDLLRGGRVSVETVRADAGDIEVNATNLVQLHDAGSITTSVAGGDGDGGNIRIDPVFVILDGGSEIIANAREGAGGNIDIRITGGGLLKSPDSVIEASSEFGVDGSVRIDSPETDVIKGIVALPAEFLDVSSLLSDRCGARDSDEVSSFVVTGRGNVPPGPEDSTLGSYSAPFSPSAAQRNVRSEALTGLAGFAAPPPDCGPGRDFTKH